MRWLVRLAVLALVFGGAVLLTFVDRAQRALPRLDGTRAGTGVGVRVEILRDRYGVPHIFAASDDDAYFGLGYCHGQDRLFQMDVLRHLGQGRISELFGEKTLKTDRLFRTLDLQGVGRRMLAQARPEARSALEAYARGVNLAAAEASGTALPIEFAILGMGFEAAKPDDFLGILGYMAWGLEMSWVFDPLVERLVAKVGAERATELLPWNFGGEPAVHPGASASVAHATHASKGHARADLSLFDLSDFETQLLATVPALRASNNWVLGPSKTTTGRPILANDPHLGHGLPPLWYEAHLVSPGLDVAGVTIPGLPLVAIGRNRDIAWGMTNVMLDGGDFFLEKVAGDRVLSRGESTRLEERVEEIRVRGGVTERLVVRSTPHGPLVGQLLEGEQRALAYRWNFMAATDANEIEGFYLLNRARDWSSFREALSHFGAIAQNVAYADREGHIGLQTSGRIPRYKPPKLDGTCFRDGWEGSEDWDGFIPFEDNPSSFDPPQGWLASANNPTVARSSYYISDQWEPVDRIRRIHELIGSKQALSVQDVTRMQADTILAPARNLVPIVLDAFDAAPARDGRVAEALEVLRAWDFDMRSEVAAPVLFACFQRRLYEAIFADEMGAELAKAWRSKANLWAIMVGTVVERRLDHWFDRADTPEREDRAAVFRAAFERAVRDAASRFGDDPRSARWGALHTLTFHHALGRGSRLLALYFDRGPFGVPGHAGTVNKMEAPFDGHEVTIGPSTRQITDLGDLDASLAVLPGGQSGSPASPHYDDQLRLWLRGEHHPLPLSREAVERITARRLVLEPR